MEDNNQKIQWHQAFVGAMHCELGEDQEKLIFEQEYSITKKPLQVDLLIIKKLDGDELHSSIGSLLSRYNIIEYKSPGDSLGVNALFQVLTYACYYKASTDHEDERKDTDITVILVRNEYPETLAGYLTEKGCRLQETEPGICQITGQTFFRMIILATGRMDQQSHIWLNSLRGNLKKKEYIQLLESCRNMAASEGDYLDALLSVVEKSNVDHKKWKEESDVASLLAEARKEGISIGEKRGISIGEKRGISIGEQRGEQNGKCAVAVNLLRSGKLTADEVVSYTGLTYEQVSQLQRELSGDTPSGRPF